MANKLQKLPKEILTHAFQPQVLKMNFAPKALQAILGPTDALIIQAVVYMLGNPERFSVIEYGEHQWVARSLRQLAEWVVIPKATLSDKGGPIVRLGELRLVLRITFTNTTFWRVDFDRLALFLLAALVLHSCQSHKEWMAWAEPSGIIKAFIIGAKPVFPTDEKGFKNRTPFAVSKSEELLRGELNRAFRNWDQKAFAELLYGATQKGELYGFHVPLTVWKPCHPHMESIRPLHGIHDTPDMVSMPQDWQDCLEP